MNGPKLWSNIIWSLPEQAEVVIAGGCIRDWMLGVPEKDIDVFFKVQGERVVLNPERWTADPNQIAPEEMQAYQGMNNITSIANMRFEDHAVQLIRLTPETDLNTYVDNFDISICMGRYGLGQNRGLRIPPAMARDLENKVIFCEGQTNQTSVRARRFLEKISQYEQGWVIENDPVRDFQPNNPFADAVPAALEGVGF